MGVNISCTHRQCNLRIRNYVHGYFSDVKVDDSRLRAAARVPALPVLVVEGPA